MTLPISIVTAFISGALFEFGCVWWVHHAEEGHPLRTAAWSTLNAACEVAGLGQSVTHPLAAVAFALGYGFGSFLGVTLAKRRRPRTRAELVAASTRLEEKLDKLRIEQERLAAALAALPEAA